MGYCMEQRYAKFTIKAENMAGAIAAVKALDGAEEEKGAGGCTYIGKCVSRHYSWVSRGFSKGRNTLKALLHEWRWDLATHTDEDDVELDAYGIYFDGEKIGDEEILFDAIAPFVEPGSYIEMVGEDGTIWRWHFDGEGCEEQGGTVTFE